MLYKCPCKKLKKVKEIKNITLVMIARAWRRNSKFKENFFFLWEKISSNMCNTWIMMIIALIRLLPLHVIQYMVVWYYLSVCLAWMKVASLFYYLAYFYYYLWVIMHFFVLFMSLTVLFQLTFTFIYSIFSKIILVSTK